MESRFVLTVRANGLALLLPSYRGLIPLPMLSLSVSRLVWNMRYSAVYWQFAAVWGVACGLDRVTGRKILQLSYFRQIQIRR